MWKSHGVSVFLHNEDMSHKKSLTFSSFSHPVMLFLQELEGIMLLCFVV